MVCASQRAHAVNVIKNKDKRCCVLVQSENASSVRHRVALMLSQQILLRGKTKAPLPINTGHLVSHMVSRCVHSQHTQCRVWHLMEGLTIELLAVSDTQSSRTED